jgi:hypothetical protein
MYLWMTSSILPLFSSVTCTSASFKTPLNHFQQPKNFTSLKFRRGYDITFFEREKKGVKKGLFFDVYAGLKNFSFGEPQIGHLSGGVPSTVFPQTPHT